MPEPTSKPLWQPSEARRAASNLTAFLAQVEADWGVTCGDYGALHRWSVEEMERFWDSFWRFGGVIGERGETPVLVDADKMPGARFFPEARVNFAENLLRFRDDPTTPSISWNEGKAEARELSYGRALRPEVSRRRPVSLEGEQGVEVGRPGGGLSCRTSRRR